MDKGMFLIGGILCVLGLVSLCAMELEATVLLNGLGLVFMAIGLGVDACQELFESFLSFFEDIINELIDAIR